MKVCSAIPAGARTSGGQETSNKTAPIKAAKKQYEDALRKKFFGFQAGTHAWPPTATNHQRPTWCSVPQLRRSRATDGAAIPGHSTRHGTPTRSGYFDKVL
jgi:hypothetical protein